MRHRWLLLLILPFLTSCFEDASKVEFSPSNEEGKPSFLRNGDLLFETTFTQPLETYVRDTNAEDMAERVKRSEPFYVYLTSPSCAHCTRAKDAVCSFLQQTRLEFLHLEGSSILQETMELKNAMPNLDIPKIPGSPYLLQFDGASFSLREVSPYASSPRQFGEHVLEGINVSNVFTFRRTEAFLQSGFTSYYCTSDDDPYRGKIQSEELRFSLKEFGIIEMDSKTMNLPEQSMGTLVLNGEAYDLTKNPEGGFKAFEDFLK